MNHFMHDERLGIESTMLCYDSLIIVDSSITSDIYSSEVFSQ